MREVFREISWFYIITECWDRHEVPTDQQVGYKPTQNDYEKSEGTKRQHIRR